MRRIVILLVVLAGIAAAAGVQSQRAAVSINSNRMSDSTFRESLQVLANNKNARCYFSTIYSIAPHNAAGRDSVTSTTASQWANTVIDGFAISAYADKHHLAQSAGVLAKTKRTLIAQLSTQAQALKLHCPGTARAAFAALPTSVQTLLLRSTAASEELVRRLGTAIAITVPNLTTYYQAHQSSYDTLCIAVAVVPQAQLSNFHADQRAGMSVKGLVAKYSVDTQSKAKGGSLGCFAPSSTSYSTVRTDVAGQAPNTFGATPRAISYSGVTVGLYVAVTSRTTNSFSNVEQLVASDVQSQNSTTASALQNSLLYKAAVAIDPALGRWGLASSGPPVFVPGVPAITKFDRATLRLVISQYAPTYQ